MTNGTPLTSVTTMSAPLIKSMVVDIEADYEEPFALSSAQYGMWLSQQLHPAATHSVAHYMEIRGPLDIPLLGQATRMAAIETGSLYTRLLPPTDVGGVATPVRQILDLSEDTDQFNVVDLTMEADPIESAHAWMNAEFTAPIDLYRDVLCAAAILTVGVDHHLWYARAHHVVIDGYGSAVIAMRTAEIYTHLQRGDTPPPAASRHPRAFITAEETYRSSTRIERDRKYWEQVATELPEPVSIAEVL